MSYGDAIGRINDQFHFHNTKKQQIATNQMSIKRESDRNLLIHVITTDY